LSIKVLQSEPYFDIKTLQKYDTEGMYKIYDMWPQIAKESYQANLVSIELENVNHIIFCGMGGSGALGDIFSSILSKTKIHVSVVKGYILPKTVDSDSLVVATSASGNTVETLTVLESAKKLGSNTISFSFGGKMREFCKKHGLEHRNLLMPHSPRASLTSFLYSMLKVLEPVLPIKGQDVTESIFQLEKTREKISSSNLTEFNPALDLASWITETPIIYYPYGLQAAAIRFKNSLQENSKMHVIVEEILEASHNGIVTWELPSKIKPILIEGTEDNIKTKERWIIFKEYFEERGIDFREVFSGSGSILSKIINLNYLLDYTTIYRAALSGINPSPVKSIDYIKKKLMVNEN